MKSGYDVHFKKIKKNGRFKVKPTPTNPQQGSRSLKVQKKKRKQEFPLLSVLITLFILCGMTYGYLNPHIVEKYYNEIDLSDVDISNWSLDGLSFVGIEIGFLGKADAQQKVPADSPKKENSAEAKSLEANEKQTHVKGLTPEEVALFNSLDERKEELDQREAELKKLEEELHKQKVELEKRLVQLEELRSQIGNQLQERVNTDAEQVDKLVAFYSSMKPASAAKIIEEINEDLAVEVLKKMKKKDAAEIMNMIKAEKAQRLSEKFAGYKN